MYNSQFKISDINICIVTVVPLLFVYMFIQYIQHQPCARPLSRH